MENNPEAPEPQNLPAGGGEPSSPEETITLSKKEIDDLKHRAEVSSQNFERAKKAEDKASDLEQRLQQYEAPAGVEPEELGQVKSDVAELRKKLDRSEVIESYPVLKEHWSALEEFRTLDENKGMNLRTAAKAFLVEKGLLEAPRPGLERPTGGPRTPVSTKMIPEEVKQLRENDPRKYREMLLSDKLDF